jgi:hypothetical protein
VSGGGRTSDGGGWAVERAVRVSNPNRLPYIGRGGAASPRPDWRPGPRLQPARARASPSAFARPRAWPIRWAVSLDHAWLAGPSSGWLLAWASFIFVLCLELFFFIIFYQQYFS